MKKEPLKINAYYSDVLVGILSAIFSFLIFSNSYQWFKNLGTSNITFYITMVCCSYIIGLLFEYFFRKIDIRVKNILFLVILIIATFWIVYSIIFVRSRPQLYYLWSMGKYNLLNYLLIILIQIIISFSVLKKNKYSKVYRIVLSVGVLSIVFFFQFITDEFQLVYSVRHHINAYLTSIINCTNYQPYSNFNRSIYGFYAILFLIPVKMLQKIFLINKFHGIIIIITLLTLVCIACYIYILNYLTKNDVIFTYGLLSLGTYLFEFLLDSVYYQIVPHRILFPLLLASLIIHIEKKEISFLYLIPVVSLSLMWNIEIGLICLATFVVFVFYKGLSNNLKIINIIFNILLSFSLPAIIAYALVQSYNLLFGGEILTLKDMIFPHLFSSYGVIQMLEIELPNCFNSWFGVSLLSLVIFIAYTSKFIFYKQKLSGKELIATLVSILCLGSLTYYINRAFTGNTSVSYIYIYILVVYLADLLVRNNISENRIISGICIILPMFYLCLWSMPTFTEFKNSYINNKNKYVNYAKESKRIYDEIDSIVVEGTAGVGINVPELYAMLNRDTKIYLIDFADFGALYGTEEKFQEEMDKYDYLIISKDTYDKYSYLMHHGVFREFGNDNLKYYYCVKEEWRY